MYAYQVEGALFRQPKSLDSSPLYMNRAHVGEEASQMWIHVRSYTGKKKNNLFGYQTPT